MINRFFMSLFVALSCCFAQSDSVVPFSINSYKPLYSAKRTLNIAPFFNMGSRLLEDNQQYDSTIHFYDENSRTGQGGFNAHHFYRKQMQASDFAMGTYLKFHADASSESEIRQAMDGSDSAMNKESNRYLSIAISQEYRHRFYLPMGRHLFAQWFLRPELGLYRHATTLKKNTMYYSSAPNSDWADYYSMSRQTKYIQQSIHLPVQLFFGYGSVYDVTSAAIAMNIHDRILGKGVSESPVQSHAVRNYANRIDALRNKRVFDFRDALISDVAELCDSLQPDSGEKLTPRQVMEVAEEWQYGLHQVRMKGLEIAIGPEMTGFVANQNDYFENGFGGRSGPRIDYNDYFWDNIRVYQHESESHGRNFNSQLVLIAHIQYAKPIGRRLQYLGNLLYSLDVFDKYASTLHSLFRESPQDHPSHYTVDNSISWFANTRTTISLSQQYTMTADHAPDLFSWKLGTNLQADYYLSPRVKFTGAVRHYYLRFNDSREIKVRPDKSTQQDLWLSASMTWDPF